MRVRGVVAACLALGVGACSEGPTSPMLESTVSALLFDGRLLLGEVQTFSGATGDSVTLTAGTTESQYLLVPFNASGAGDANLAVEVSVQGGSTAAVAPSRSLAAGPPLLGRAGPREDESFHLALRERERRELGPRIQSARQNIPVRSLATALAVPAVGDTLTLNASLAACTGPRPTRGRVVAVSSHAIIVEDVNNPAGGFTAAEYQGLAAEFDNTIYDVVTTNFGQTADIDGNGRAIMFFTRVVNELTEAGSTSYTGGFFYSRDIFPKADCATSNVGELFYLLAPDPNGEINGNVRSHDFILRVSAGTIAHEYQHLINASRRIYVNDASAFEETWLNEGLSHISEELVFYRASGLSPRQNIDIGALRQSQQILNAVNRYQVSNLSRYITYLENPDEESLFGIDNLETRGAAWAFLRYAADYDEGADQPFWFALANAQATGLNNLQNVLGSPPLDLVQTWTAAVYTDDLVPTFNDLYEQPSWDFRSVLAVLNDGTFPLETHTIGSTPTVLTLEAGGAAHLLFTIPAGGRATVNITSGGAIPTNRLRTTLVRTQ